MITAAVPILAATTAPSVNFGAEALFEPAKSPPNWIIPFAVVDASGVPAVTADFTKAVVAISVLFVPGAAVGAVGVPVKAGEANGAAPVTSATGMLETEERVVSDPFVIYVFAKEVTPVPPFTIATVPVIFVAFPVMSPVTFEPATVTILASVTAPSAILPVDTAAAAILPSVTAAAPNLVSVTAPTPILASVTASFKILTVVIASFEIVGISESVDPAKSPANFNVPCSVNVALGTEAAVIAACTKAALAICCELSFEFEIVGTFGAPENSGEDKFAFSVNPLTRGAKAVPSKSPAI